MRPAWRAIRWAALLALLALDAWAVALAFDAPGEAPVALLLALLAWGSGAIAGSRSAASSWRDSPLLLAVLLALVGVILVVLSPRALALAVAPALGGWLARRGSDHATDALLAGAALPLAFAESAGLVEIALVVALALALREVADVARAVGDRAETPAAARSADAAGARGVASALAWAAAAGGVAVALSSASSLPLPTALATPTAAAAAAASLALAVAGFMWMSRPPREA